MTTQINTLNAYNGKVPIEHSMKELHFLVILPGTTSILPCLQMMGMLEHVYENT